MTELRDRKEAKPMRRVILLIAVCGLAYGLLAIFNAGIFRKTILPLSGKTMGTTYSVKLVIDSSAESKTENIQPEIDSILENINQQMSTWRDDSEISRFNQSKSTEWFPVSSETMVVVKEALHINAKSSGAFDITVSPLVNLWNFGPDPQADKIPSNEKIKETLLFVGSSQMEVRTYPSAIRKMQSRISIDLSGIAKGFAVDRISVLLTKLGFNNHMVEIGGEIRTRGTRPDGSPWGIAVSQPESDRFEIHDVVSMKNLSMATSGDYRNYFEIDGQRYSHTIDPRTGKPIDHRLASVTVLHENCMTADALATAVMVLGPEAGYNWAEEHSLSIMFLVRSETGTGFDTKLTSAWSRQFPASAVEK